VNLKWLIGAVISVASISPMLAQSGNSINPPTTPQTAPMTASERKNLDMVLKLWREVIEAHHTELAETYLAEDYIQHNPNVPTGRAAFIKLFSGSADQPDSWTSGAPSGRSRRQGRLCLAGLRG